MVTAIIQARMTSSRLPGKVLLPLVGEPMLWRQIERVGRAKLVDKVIVATSVENTDDDIVKLAERFGFAVFRGSLNDVLDRYYSCAKSYNATHIVRITADCPLIDPEVIDRTIEMLLVEGADYATSDAMKSWPDGLDVSVMTMAALEESWRKAKAGYEREHMIKYIENHADEFKWVVFRNDVDFGLGEMHWSVDLPEDYQFVSAVYEGIYPDNAEFKTNDVITWLRNNSQVLQLNKR